MSHSGVRDAVCLTLGLLTGRNERLPWTQPAFLAHSHACGFHPHRDIRTISSGLWALVTPFAGSSASKGT